MSSSKLIWKEQKWMEIIGVFQTFLYRRCSNIYFKKVFAVYENKENINTLI